MSTTTPLGFIVPVDADAPNGPLEIGGNAETADTLLQKGGVGGHFFSGGSAVLTRASTSYGSFSTPIKVELLKVAADQRIDIVFFAMALTGPATAEKMELALWAGGSVVKAFGAGYEKKIEAGTAGSWVPIGSGLTNFNQNSSFLNTEAQSKEIAAGMESGNTLLFTEGESAVVKHRSAEDKPLAIEIVGKIPSGTAKLIGAYLSVRVSA